MIFFPDFFLRNKKKIFRNKTLHGLKFELLKGGLTVFELLGDYAFYKMRMHLMYLTWLMKDTPCKGFCTVL